MKELAEKGYARHREEEEEFRKTSIEVYGTAAPPSKKRISISVGETSERNLPHTTFKIPVRVTEHLEAPLICLLYLKARSADAGTMRPKLLPAKLVRAETVLMPTLSIVHEPIALMGVRVPTLAPIALLELATPSPRLRLRSPYDVSVRVLQPEPIRNLGVLRPFIKPIRLTVRHPPIVPGRLGRSHLVYVPKISTATDKADDLLRVHPQLPIRESTPKPAAQGDREEVPFFYKLFFEGAEGLVSANRPVCAILSKPPSDSFVDALALICRELYRVKKGGKPSPRVLTKGSKEEVESSLKAGDRIFIVDDSKCELINPGRVRRLSDVNWDRLYDRLRELFSQDYGFVIFHLHEEWVDGFRSKLMEVAHMIPELVVVRPRYLSGDVKKEIVGLCWGFARSEGETFDELFCNAEKAFYGKLESIGRDEWLMHCTRPHGAEHGDPEVERESPEHRLLKALVVKIIARERGVTRERIPERILTEHVLAGGIVADIFLADSGEVVEIETLYGTGFNPMDKLDHGTLQKYVGSGVRKVRVVLLPLHFFTYLGSLARLRRLYRDRYGLDAEFCTVDIENEKLVSLADAVELLKRLRERIEGETLLWISGRE